MIETLHLFPKLHQNLMEFIRGLDERQWATPTGIAGRSVKDMAAHLVDLTVRRLSYTRDNYISPDSPGLLNDHDEIVDFVQLMNREWIRAFRRVSPRIIIQMLEELEPQLWEFWQSQDPGAPAPYGVSWAGRPDASIWFDLAREYTEKWHHQAQMRDATGVGGIREPELFKPVIETFMLAMPYTFRNMKGPEGKAVRIEIKGDCGGEWTIIRGQNEWKEIESPEEVVATVRLHQELTWRLFTNSVDRQEAARQIEVVGDKEFARPILEMVAIMAPPNGAPLGGKAEFARP